MTDSGVADMTVLENGNSFTTAQKRAPLFTTATYGSDERQYNDSCKVVDVTLAQLESNDSHLASDWRMWQLYMLSSVDDIAPTAKELKMLPVVRLFRRQATCWASLKTDVR